MKAEGSRRPRRNGRKAERRRKRAGAKAEGRREKRGAEGARRRRRKAEKAAAKAARRKTRRRRRRRRGRRRAAAKAEKAAEKAAKAEHCRNEPPKGNRAVESCRPAARPRPFFMTAEERKRVAAELRGKAKGKPCGPPAALKADSAEDADAERARRRTTFRDAEGKSAAAKSNGN